MTQTGTDPTHRPWNIVLVCYWLAMFVGTHIPAERALLDDGRIDKLLHFCAYAGLAMLISLNWQLAGGHLTFRHYLVVWLVLACYGAADELLQIPVGRYASVYDWCADLTGAAAGIILFHQLRPRILHWIARRAIVGEGL